MKKSGEHGFMLLSTIFLTLIAAMAAMLILNGTKKISNQNATLRIIAINLANEQFAEIEYLAAHKNLSAGSYNFLGVDSDLKNFYNDSEKTKPIEFHVSTNVSGGENNLYNVNVKVSWDFNNENYQVEFEKIIRNFE